MLYSDKSAIVFTLPAIIGHHEPTLPKVNKFYHLPLGVRPIISALCQKRYAIFIIANIPEVEEFGMTRFDIRDYFRYLIDTKFDDHARIKDLLFEGDLMSHRAIPCTGMVKEIMRNYSLKKSDVLIVGRSPIDQKAARSIGIDYWTASKFFSTLVPVRQF